jgi:hypothetical protein
MGASKLDELIETSLNLQGRTKDLYRACVAEFVAFAGEDSSIYTSALVERWLFELLKDRKPQTVNVYRKAIRYASKRFAKHNEHGRDFAADVEKVKAQPSEPRVPLTYEEAQLLLATCDGDELVDVRDRALIVLALRSGLRRGGLRALELSGVKPPKITTINKGGNRITFEADAETLAALGAWMERLRARRYDRSHVPECAKKQDPWSDVGVPDLAGVRPACETGTDPSRVSASCEALDGYVVARSRCIIHGRPATHRPDRAHDRKHLHAFAQTRRRGQCAAITVQEN